MARPRKSTQALELSGAFKKDPQRERSPDTEPNNSGPLGAPPDCLNDDQIICWEEIVGMLQDGVLKRSDRVAIEMASRLLAKVRSNIATPSECNTLLSIVARLGATPADRNRVTVPPAAGKANLFEE